MQGTNDAVPSGREGGVAQAIVLIMVMLFPILAIAILAPALGTLIGHFRDVPPGMVPLLLTAPALCVALVAPLAGHLTDRIGRRPLLLAALAIYGLGGIIPFLVDDFWMAMIGRLALGIAEGFLMTIANTLIADYFSPKNRQTFFAVNGVIAPGLASVLIMAVGRLAAKGWQWPFALYGLAFPIFLFAWFAIFEPERRQQTEERSGTSAPSLFPWRVALSLFGFALLTSILYFVYTVHNGLMFEAVGIKDPAQLGVISGVASLAVPVGAIVYKLVANQPVNRQIALFFLLLGTGMLGVGLAKDYRWAMVGAGIEQVGAGMTIPVFISWALTLFPIEHRGKGMGAWNSAFFLGLFVCPLIVTFVNGFSGGILATSLGVGVVCLILAGMSLAARAQPQAAA